MLPFCSVKNEKQHCDTKSQLIREIIMMIAKPCHPLAPILVVLMWTVLTQVRSFSTVSVASRRFSVSASRPLFASTSLDGAKGTSKVPDDKAAQLPRIILKRNRQSRSFRDGSQLVFSGSIGKTFGSVKMASLVQVEVPASADAANEQTVVVGWGVYNPESMYRVRILCHALLKPKLSKQLKISLDDPSEILSLLLATSFQNALQTRLSMGWPSSSTDTYRLVNGEGDSLSGLAVDIIGGEVAVIMSSAAWCQVHKSTIMASLQQVLPDHELIWKTTPSRLKQDGYASHDDDDDVDSERSDQPVIGLENGVKYQTFPRQKGQKTSVYCDQRDNRSNLAQLCQNKRVLDLCCYHGGFSLNAAMHGASRVVGVDSSEDAVETCETNAQLNGITNVDFVKADISDYMKSCTEEFDVVVLDPPKLAPSATSLPKATRKYHSLNRDAIKLISEEGGLFMTCTCSAAMTQKDGGNFFLQMVQQASMAAQREITLLRVSGAASCHTQSPASFPAGNYLTAALFHVHPKE
jgi:23S rRNA G2069 N7-methylase RlmK/C1962 C5-methylase RlmI